MQKKFEFMQASKNKQAQKPLGSTHTHTHTHTLIFNRNEIKEHRKKAFTLAEVLITLAVIGIVAALTIGIFLPKIHSTIRARQIATAEVKFTKAMEQMALNNAIGPYYETTQEFVDELQNYLKIAKVCDNDHLEDCFGYKKIKLDNNKKIDIKDLKTYEYFGLKNEEEKTLYKDTVGIITLDGTGMILTWNTLCPILEPKVYAWGGNTNETTNCVSMVIDINLDNDVNMLNKDVVLFNAKKLGESCAFKFSYNGQSYCWGMPFKLENNDKLSKAECNEVGESLGISCSTAHAYDYWAWAVQKCGGTSKMPSKEDIVAFANYAYQIPLNKAITVNSGYTSGAGYTLKTELIPASFTSSYFCLASGEQSSSYSAYGKTFRPSEMFGGTCERNSNNQLYAVCKIDE